MPDNQSARAKAAPLGSDRRPLARGLPDFPIVAIGASAGGLDACRKFLAVLPPDNGMAFILGDAQRLPNRVS
jgi:two-component system CheB/CheR fusion protein